MNRRLAVCLAATFVVASILGTVTTASAATTLFVDQANASCSDAGPGSPAVPYCSIQAAVDAAAPQTTIQVATGTYQEQIQIGVGKNGLRLIGATPAPTIEAPASMVTPMAIVLVTASRPVRITGFTISGPGGSSCGSLLAGVGVAGGGRAFITRDHITAIRDEPLNGCQNGYGIDVGRNLDGTDGTAVILDDVIDDYQKSGILVSGAGSNGFIRRTTVVGAGPTTAIAQNGIQIARGAEAQIRDTAVSQNKYTTDVDGSGFLLFPNPGFVFMRDDTATANDIDVWLYGATGSKIVRVTATGATVQGFAVQGDPIFGVSTGNILKFLTATGNGGPDVQDDSTGGGTAGTANTWRRNTCGTSTPAGLCG